MYFSPTVDETTLMTSRDEKKGQEETPIGELHRPPMLLETLLLNETPGFQKHDHGTRSAAEVNQTIQTFWRSQTLAEHGPSEIERVRMRRIELLSRDTETIEDAVRLRVLTDRMRKLAPRVTDADIEKLGAITADAEKIDDTLSKLKRKYHLK